MSHRRVVVLADATGQGVVASDGPAPRTEVFQSVPGMVSSLMWCSPPGAEVGAGAAATDTTPQARFVPGPGGTCLMIVTIPPDSVMTRADFDAAAFGAECAARLPGLAETFDPEVPGMHTTDTIDYDVVLDGEITLDLGEGREVTLGRHDVCVQHGVRHAWRNRSDRPVTMLFVLVGAARRPATGDR